MRRRFGADEAAPAPARVAAIAGTVPAASTFKLRQATAEDLAQLAADVEVALAVRAPGRPEGALFGEESRWRFGVLAGEARC